MSVKTPRIVERGKEWQEWTSKRELRHFIELVKNCAEVGLFFEQRICLRTGRRRCKHICTAAVAKRIVLIERAQEEGVEEVQVLADAHQLQHHGTSSPAGSVWYHHRGPQPKRKEQQK